MTQKVPKITFNDVAFLRTRPIFSSKFLADMTKDQNHLEPNFSDLNNFCITGAVFCKISGLKSSRRIQGRANKKL